MTPVFFMCLVSGCFGLCLARVRKVRSAWRVVLFPIERECVQRTQSAYGGPRSINNNRVIHTITYNTLLVLYLALDKRPAPTSISVKNTDTFKHETN